MTFPPFQQRRIWGIAAILGIVLVLIVGMSLVLRSRYQLRTSRVLASTTGIDLESAKEGTLYASMSAPGRAPGAMEILPLKVIRHARLVLEVPQYESFDASLRSLSQRYGYLSNLQLNKDERGVRRAEIILRVEASRFDQVLTEFKRLGSVQQETISVDDVTRTYADLEARFANKRSSAARLREIIQTRTGKLADVIEAEEALSRITEEIESMEAQKRSMESQMAYSTLSAEVHEPLLKDSRSMEPGLWTPVAESLREARGALIGSLAFLLAAVIVLSPWVLILLGAFLLGRRWFRRRKAAAEVEAS
jgi:hypothetical protein